MAREPIMLGPDPFRSTVYKYYRVYLATLGIIFM
jgi:hypothetical protein